MKTKRTILNQILLGFVQITTKCFMTLDIEKKREIF